MSRKLTHDEMVAVRASSALMDRARDLADARQMSIAEWLREAIRQKVEGQQHDHH